MLKVRQLASILTMRFAFILIALILLTPFDAAFAQQPSGAGNFHVAWEVKNRFRLFRKESDFLRQEAASRGDGVLATEDRLERTAGGLGWAKDVVGNLCVDAAGSLVQTCERDGVRESYLNPVDYSVDVGITGDAPQGATCQWSFDDSAGQLRQTEASCDQEVKLRVAAGRTTVATADIPLADGTTTRVTTEITVRDMLIAGMGDSIAAGEGNPDRAVRLDSSFCFRRFLHVAGGEFYRPGRAGYTGDRTCEGGPANPASAADWARHGARWMSPGCHRSLYSYQLRTALALAVEQPHIAVTFLPLACTGATIAAGVFGPQATDDCPIGVDRCSGTAPAQFTELKDLMAAVHRQDPKRNLDMVLLTIGANDVNFAGLVANVIVDGTTERLLLKEGGSLASALDAERSLDLDLPDEFARLRAGLKPYVNGDMGRVVFVSYANPALQAPNVPCPGGLDGLDVHPAFNADPTRLREAAAFVDAKFLPKLKMLATCEGGKVCKDPLGDRMTFVDSHQATFAQHGMCAHAPTDPEFDRACFSQTGDTFEKNIADAADDPMICSSPVSEYRPYASRARWIRTANDSYFTAMTYPVGISPVLRPSDIHDAIWGVVSAVYGGAIHPTAEGYAAIADAALPAARGVLGLTAPSAILTAPLAPPPDVAPAAVDPPAAPATPPQTPVQAPGASRPQ
jgi:hypothetical protein